MAVTREADAVAGAAARAIEVAAFADRTFAVAAWADGIAVPA